jgi:flagellar motor component MotA
MKKSLIIGFIIVLLIVLIGFLKNDYKLIMTYTFYSTTILFVLGALLSFTYINSTLEQSPYYQHQEQEKKDNKSRIKWISFFFISALPSLVTYIAFYFIVQ